MNDRIMDFLQQNSTSGYTAGEIVCVIEGWELNGTLALSIILAGEDRLAERYRPVADALLSLVSAGKVQAVQYQGRTHFTVAER